MLKQALEILLTGSDIPAVHMHKVALQLLNEAEPVQIAALLSLLRLKGESEEELYTLAKVLREKMVKVVCDKPLVDIVGTGGDGQKTVNISTGAALLTASLGVPVAKHGNRSVSSQCGSADVLEKLGVQTTSSPQEVEASVKEVGFGFMFAPVFHPTLKQVATTRKKLGFPSIFNLLGPLLNPAEAEFRVIGVSDSTKITLMAKTARRLGVKRGVVIHGCGLDELSPLGVAKGVSFDANGLRPFTVEPLDFAMPRCSLKELQGGGSEQNALLLKEALSGKRGAIFDALSLNAGCALWVVGKASSLKEGVAHAKEGLINKAPVKLLEKLQKIGAKS